MPESLSERSQDTKVGWGLQDLQRLQRRHWGWVAVAVGQEGTTQPARQRGGIPWRLGVLKGAREVGRRVDGRHLECEVLQEGPGELEVGTRALGLRFLRLTIHPPSSYGGA